MFHVFFALSPFNKHYIYSMPVLPAEQMFYQQNQSQLSIYKPQLDGRFAKYALQLYANVLGPSAQLQVS
jgi:hypothetical protein